MLVLKARRVTLYVVEVCLLVDLVVSAVQGKAADVSSDNIRAPRKRGRESYVPCPHSKCQCKPDKRGDVIARCIKVSERLPEFVNLNVTFRELILAHRNLTELPDRGFRGVKTKILDVGNNPLSTERIGDLAFEGLENVLESLWLSDCGLAEAPNISLSILTNLKVLHLEDNRIAEIPARFLSANRRLQEIYLNRNGLRSISLEAFVELKNLKQLKLGQNELRTLPSRLFKSLSNLTSLDLSQNLLHTVVPGTFDGLRSLRWLELESNLISSVSRDSFRGARKLKNMKLESNQLRVIDDNAFTAIDKLGYLSIDVVNVSSLTNKTFAGLGRLETLSVGEIAQTHLPDGLLSSMTNLKRLSLYDNMGKFSGLRKNMFAERFAFKKLSVFVSPVRSCRCSEAWIKNMTSIGAYIHGHCSDSRPLSCTSKASGSSDGSDKNPNNGRRKYKTP